MDHPAPWKAWGKPQGQVSFILPTKPIIRYLTAAKYSGLCSRTRKWGQIMTFSIRTELQGLQRAGSIAATLLLTAAVLLSLSAMLFSQSQNFAYYESVNSGASYIVR
jgi:hypothetical protein